MLFGSIDVTLLVSERTISRNLHLSHMYKMQFSGICYIVVPSLMQRNSIHRNDFSQRAYSRAYHQGANLPNFCLAESAIMNAELLRTIVAQRRETLHTHAPFHSYRQHWKRLVCKIENQQYVRMLPAYVVLESSFRFHSCRAKIDQCINPGISANSAPLIGRLEIRVRLKF